MHPLNLKSNGMSLAANANIELLILARNIAHRIGQRKGECSINDIRKEWTHPAPMGQWSGKIFTDGSWRYIKHIPSLHEKGRGRYVSLWRYTDKPPAENKVESKPLINLAKKVEFGQKTLFDMHQKHYE